MGPKFFPERSASGKAPTLVPIRNIHGGHLKRTIIISTARFGLEIWSIENDSLELTNL